MILSAQFANAERTAVVVITDDRGAVAISPDRAALWAEYQAWPGITAAFVPEDLNASDLVALNAMLAAPGSLMRAIAEVQFGIIKGTIPVNPSITPAQYKALLASKMALQRT